MSAKEAFSEDTPLPESALNALDHLDALHERIEHLEAECRAVAEELRNVADKPGRYASDIWLRALADRLSSTSPEDE